MKKSIYAVLCTAVFTLAMCFSACGSDNDSTPSSKKYPGVGDRIPILSVDMTNLAGDDLGKFSTSSLSRPVLFMLFNPGCPECQKQLPAINQFYEQARTRGAVDVVLVARTASFDEIANLWRDRGFTLPFSPQPDRTIYHLFATETIPRIYLCGKDGRINKTYIHPTHATVESLNNDFGLNVAPKAE